jgi:cytochrome P450 family 110
MTNSKSLNLSKASWQQKIQWVVDPIGYMESAVQSHPEIFQADVMGLGSKPVFINNPQVIQQILTNDTKEFTAPGNVNKILIPLTGESSLFVLEKNEHQSQRKLLMPPFHGERMRSYGKLICDITEKVMEKLTPNQVFLARTTMQDISLQVILQVVFGLYEGERYQELKQLLGKMMELFQSTIGNSFLFFPFLQQNLGKWTPWGYFLWVREQTDRLLYQEINERRNQPDIKERKDILSLMMTARDENGEPMTDKELRDELLTILLAGHETTATAMAWSLYWTHRYPKIKEELQKEIDNLGKSPEPMKVYELSYLTSVCNETLRIHPVAMLTLARKVMSSTEIMGYQFSPGSILVGCIYLLHHREDLYPNPKEFQPERFLERQYSPYEFMPFGGGVRRCLGAALALYEMKLVLTTVLSNYELELLEQKTVIPERRGITLAPKGGIEMRFKGKRNIQKQTSSKTEDLVIN